MEPNTKRPAFAGLCFSISRWRDSISYPSLVGPVSADRHAVYGPLGSIVDSSVVLRTTVIPHRDCVFFPVETHHKLGLLDVLLQERQQRITFGTLQTQDMRGKVSIDKQAFAAGLRMCTHDRVFNRRRNFMETVNLIKFLSQVS